ncbi:hypothetical protein Pan54_10760 [Rubinisphaera italica]|uniref:Uncharacterized protein n=1 Tax=Rubinisphaera italica TaxID=2527969 RepID=A0A5C5XEL7_9PLAN|nr:hypothetical protein Pan54_10760 [Rubinisphaera italica]
MDADKRGCKISAFICVHLRFNFKTCLKLLVIHIDVLLLPISPFFKWNAV